MNIDDRWVCSRCLHLLERNQRCGNCGFSETDYVAKAHHLPPEALLKNRYLVACALGEGGFGITYAGWDLTLDKPIAIKEYYPAGLSGRDAEKTFHIQLTGGAGSSWFYAGRERFLREARILAMLSGVRGIVPVRDFFEENETAYIVMDFIHGESLREFSRHADGKLPAGELLSLLRPVVDALILVHQSGILHRDISPDNIIIDRTGTAWLIDFGAAEEIRPEYEDKSHAIILRKGYTPLEQYDSHGQQGPWSDVYALAATVYDLLCGEAPEEAILRTGRDPLRAPRARGARVSRRQQRAVLHGLALKVSDRPLNMEHFRSELYHLPLPSDLRRRRTFTRAFLGLCAILLLVGGCVALNQTVGLPAKDGLRFRISAGGVSLSAYSGSGAQIALPARFLGLPVRAVAREALREQATLQTLSLPQTLREVGDLAFSECASLTHIELPDGVAAIGAYAFAGCESLGSVTIPDSVTTIDATAFEGCSDSLVLSGSDRSAAKAFADTHVRLYCNPSRFSYRLSNGAAVIEQYNGDETRVVVPGYIDGFPVAAIGKHAFAGSDVGEVIVSNGVRRVEQSAFASCFSLTSVFLPPSVTMIGDGAFYDCPALAGVSLSQGLQSIGSQAFANDRALGAISLPSSLSSLGTSAFEGCSSLRSVTIPATLTSLPEAAFYYCDQLASISLSEGLRVIGPRAFQGCASLQQLQLPEGVEEIGEQAFGGCASLQTLYVPKTVRAIDTTAFGTNEGEYSTLCRNLTVIGYGNAAASRAAAFAGISYDDAARWEAQNLFSYTVEDGCVTLTGYSGSAVHLVLPTYLEGMPVTAIGVDAFSDLASLESVVLPHRLEVIENSAFGYCANLRRVTFPPSLRRIDYYAFYRCNLDSVALPDSVTTLGYNVFEENLHLTKASLGSGLTGLDSTVFSGCSALETLEIASAGSVAGFSGSPALRTVVLGGGVRAILSGAFADCPALKNVYCSSGVVSIANDAFDARAGFTLHADGGSFAAAYSKQRGIRFSEYP